MGSLTQNAHSCVAARKSDISDRSIFIDWLSGSSPSTCELSKIYRIFGNQWVEQHRANRTHTQILLRGNVRLMLQPREPRYGFRFVVSGQGCRQLEHEGIGDWFRLFETLTEQNVRFARIDTAIDDKAASVNEGVLHIEQVDRAIREGRVVSRYEVTMNHEGRWLKTGDSKGTTILFGKRTSQTSIRIYDKAKQTGSTDLHWVRCELETHGSQAQALAESLLERRSLAIVAELIYGRLDFKERGKCKGERRDMWQTASWWSSFLNTAHKARLKSASDTATNPDILRTIEYVERAFPRQLAIYMHYYEGDLSRLINLIQTGEKKLTPQDKALIIASKELDHVNN